MSRLGELLVRENLISPRQLQEARKQAMDEGGRVGYSLTKLGFIAETDLTNFLSKQYGVPAINLSEFDIDEDVLGLIPRDVPFAPATIPRGKRRPHRLLLSKSQRAWIMCAD